MMETCLEERETIPEETEDVAECQKVPNKEAEVDAIRALEDQYGCQHLAIRHRGRPKKWTQGNGGSW
jgi:hypothetical protein